MLERSEPVSGSDSAAAARNSPRALRGWYLRRCSSLMAWAPKTPLPRAMMLATLIHPRASSSVIRQYSKQPRPTPPYSSGTMMPK